MDFPFQNMLQYKVGCRECFTGGSFGIWLSDKDYRENLIGLMPEYEVVEFIEEWREDNDYYCNSCGSSNVDIYDVQINNKPVFSDEKVLRDANSMVHRIFHITIDKIGGKYKLQRLGHKEIEPRVERESLRLIINKLNSFPNAKFISKSEGYLSFCLTGAFAGEDKTDFEYTIQKIQFYGLSKEEILEQLLPIARKSGVESSSMSPDVDILNGQEFKGIYFDRYIVDKEDKANEGGYSPVNIVFRYGNGTYIAYGCENRQSAKQLMWDKDFNLSTFQVDLNREPVFIKGAKVFYAKLINDSLNPNAPKLKWWKKLFG